MLKTRFGRGAQRVTALAIGLGVIVVPMAFSPVANASTTTQLTLTYSSPSTPWTATQVQTMQGWAAQALPLITAAYGQPMHSITVNVVQGGIGTYAGEYDPNTNTASLGSFAEDVFIHELIHAYRDDDIIGLATWEEGMTRATEVQVASQIMPGYWDTNHSDPYDVYYDNVNKPKMGVVGGSINGAGSWTQGLLRYQVAGYAWGKVLIQSPQFLPKLNAALYANPTLANSETGLINLAASLQAKVEGVPFKTWYAAQGIFNSKVTPGCFLSQRISQYTVDTTCRDAAGNETPTPMNFTWSITGAAGTVLASGSGTTNSYGWKDITPSAMGGYTGRIKISLSATYNGVAISDFSWRTVGSETGVFGVSTVANTGTVAFSSLDGTFTPFSVPVANGAFQAPSLQTVRGRIKATFTGPNGSVIRFFDKDASAYSLVLKTK